MHLKYLDDSTKTGVETLKTATVISDAEGFKEYINAQVATSKQFTERAIEDGKTDAELGNNYATEAQ